MKDKHCCYANMGNHPCNCNNDNASTSAEVPGYGAWFSVKNSNPEEGVRCLIYIEDSAPQVAPMLVTGQRYQGKWIRDDIGVNDIFTDRYVTHWMPLPAAP